MPVINKNISLQPQVGEKKGIFDGIFSLPKFKLPWSDNQRRRQGVESNVEVVPLGVKPGAQAKSDKVPINRSGGKEKGPQVYPSSFGGNSEPVQPLETNNNDHFLGPRGLKFNKREAGDEILERSRRGLNDELGVLSGYQVISEVDLAFKPSFEDGVGVTTFQGKILPEEIVYGVCLPATGFSVLFVLLSLLTVISVLVSGIRALTIKIQFLNTSFQDLFVIIVSCRRWQRREPLLLDQVLLLATMPESRETGASRLSSGCQNHKNA